MAGAFDHQSIKHSTVKGHIPVHRPFFVAGGAFLAGGTLLAGVLGVGPVVV